mmetsp:Transcript_12209/g.23156  ORF Transcript_12209/g.23156 Transcript_12209/m.23156 type:complete len:286 (-) Transcript_12209:386-1243(-)|eukprot:CAMPEP_0204900052 /NCGR_PEP_ID=MMETSP1397-20131031/2232_1 /ASSEMBLY_ACC=CAM_ASM_000891 /TAXON_ID=49980 /ORGANISM="Climacostomum Climacostomum virens, Strain Stock W-24" /LENGTH=285 /DNA_ID=CAMNT_0052068121 /DNA_START=298 /DNA_END=1155 /DNA_ORIENTATION=+
MDFCNNLITLFDYFLILVGVSKLFTIVRGILLLVLSEFKTINLKKYRPGSWAIITGSTDGIGKALTEQLAAQGFNIYQISIFPDKLNAMEEALTSKYNIQVKSRHLDLKKCASDLSEFISLINEDIEGKDLSILVNNAGVSEPGAFYSITLAQVNNVVTVNCLPIVYLTRLILPKLYKRGLPCAVINLSSVASVTPIPGDATYAATKKFDDYFTEVLNCRSRNVTFMSLKPGFTLTNMTAKFKDLPLRISPEECANAALRDLGSDLSFVGHYKHKLFRLYVWSRS